MQSEPHAAHSESSYVYQHLRSVIIHSLDTFNYNNAEFACERLLALDDDNLDSMYLYCLTLFHQGKYKTCYSLLVRFLNRNHLGFGFLFAKCCSKLKKYKEGIYQLVKLNYLYNESSFGQAQGYNDNSNSQFLFASSQQKYNYEHKRSVYPDSSIIYHVLADLYKANGDIKNSALNYVQALKFNQFDFEAFQELCKLGVNVKVKSIYKPNQLKSNGVLHPSNDDILPSASHSYDFNDGISNPFSNSVPGGAPTPHGNQVNPAHYETPLIHPDDTFNHAISTPRIRTTVVPDAPLRKSNPNSTNTNGAPPNHFEFTKPNFPVDSNDKKHKKESTYSKITSRLISQPGVSGGASVNTGPNTSNPGGNSNTSKLLETPGPKKGMRSNLKRNSSSGLIPTMNQNNNDQESHTSMTILKEIEKGEAYLLKLYTVFAKSFKCMCKYDCYKAIRLLEESLSEKDKETPWVLSKLGRLHYEIVNYKQSEYFFSKLRKLDRTRLEDMEYYSTLLWHLHRKIELTYLANELHDLDPNSAITWCVIGNLFSLTREQDEAIKCFDKATKIDENFTYAYTLKGHEYFGNDNYEMALENFRISLLIDSRHYNALYGIGMVYINLGDYQKADYHFRKAVSINPINIILICCVGMVLEKLGKKNLALRQYELANKLQPLNPLPIFKKAQSLFAMQQFPQALKYFETLKELAPDEASVHFLLGQLYNIQNDKFLAIKEFTIAMNLDPKGNYLIREAMESLKTDS